MYRTNAEIDQLYETVAPILKRVAQSACSHRAEELQHEIWLVWYFRYLKDPERWWRIFTQPAIGYVTQAARWMAFNVIREWQRTERNESLDALEDKEDRDECNSVEWGPTSDINRYADGGVGIPRQGNYIATDEDVYHLFERVAAHNLVTKQGNDLGRVDALDLIRAFQSATPRTARIIRLFASGYSRDEIGSNYAIDKAKNHLRSVLQ